MILEPVISSGLKTADTAVLASPGLLFAVTLVPAAADCSIVVYDNATTNSGTVLAKVSGVAATSTGSTTITFPYPVMALNGLYGDISGAAAGFILHYTKSF